jgi:hypothetical protein
MLYIKLDENGAPINHPMMGDNLKMVLEVACLDDDTLAKYGYAKFEFIQPTADAVVIPSTDYYMGTDGVVRNRVTVREFTQEELTEKFIRSRRSYLLAACDWTQAVDSPLSVEKKTEWAAYRQALRDLTTLYPDVQQADDVVWPVEPSKA